MAQGKKTDSITIYKVMISYITTRNYSETARQLDMPESTVRKIIDDNKDKEEFTKLCEEKRDEFVDKATRIINKALDRLDKVLEDKKERIPVNNLSTVIGTLYDKRALSKGEMTQNVGFATNFDLDKLVDIAGYTKKAEDSK